MKPCFLRCFDVIIIKRIVKRIFSRIADLMEGAVIMIYEIRHFDTVLIRFSADSGAERNIRLIWVNDEKKGLIPLDLPELSADGVDTWIRHRTLPKNRAYVSNLLSTMGLSINRPLDVIRVSKGLSLNDCYWVVEEGFSGSFAQYNLYENRFSRVLGQIAFIGYGSSGAVVSSSPEFTTNGMLPKCWRRDHGVIRLYKGGTEGASNTGNEPYSEFYASAVAQLIGVNAVPYNLSKWKGKLCSTCELFTSKELSYVPVGRIVHTGGMAAVRAFYASLGEPFVRALHEMIVFDAVIFNTDRHFGNFGFLVNSRTNEIVAPAPLFDHGNALFNLAGQDALQSEQAMLQYARTLLPCVYDDFVEEAKKVITHEQKNELRKLLNVRLKRHSAYNLDKKRLTLIEKMIRLRAAELIGD